MSKKIMIGLLFLIFVSLQFQFVQSKTLKAREDFNAKRFVNLEGLWILDNVQQDKRFFKNEKRFVFLYFSEMQLCEYKPKVVTKTSTVRASNPAGGYTITNSRDYTVRDGSLPANLRINGQYQCSTMQILSFDNNNNVVHAAYPACIYFLGTAKLPTLTICQGTGPSKDFFTPLSIQPKKSKSKECFSYWLQANNRNYFVLRKPTPNEFGLFMAIRSGKFNDLEKDNAITRSFIEISLGKAKPDVLDRLEADLQILQENEEIIGEKANEYIAKITMEQIPAINGLWFHQCNNQSETLFKGEKKYTFFYFPKAEYLTSFDNMRDYSDLPENFHFSGSFARSEAHIITFNNEEDIEYLKRGVCLYRHGFPIMPTMSLYDNSTKKADCDFIAQLNFKKRSVTLSIDGSKVNSKLLTLTKGKKNFSLICPPEQEMRLFFLVAMHYQESPKMKKKNLENSFLNNIPEYDSFKKEYGITSNQSDLESDIRSSIETIEVREVKILPRDE